MSVLLARNILSRCLCTKMANSWGKSSNLLRKSIGYPQIYIKENVCAANFSNKFGVASQDRYLKIEPKWLERDKIPSHFSLIYKSPMGIYLGIGAFLTTGIIIVTIAQYLINGIDIDSLYVPATESGNLVIAKSHTEFYFFCAFFIFLTASLRLFTSRFALRIYKYEKDYVAVFQGSLPGMKVKHRFTAGTVEYIHSKAFIQWQESKYRLGNKTAYMLEDYFRKPRDLNEMLVGFRPDEYDSEEK